MAKQTLTLSCRHKGKEVAAKECDNTRIKREQLCRNASCPFVANKKIEGALGKIGRNETVFCRGEEILARACLLRQALAPDGCGECAEPTRMCTGCGKTKKEALTAFDPKLGLCLECAVKKGVVVTDSLSVGPSAPPVGTPLADASSAPVDEATEEPEAKEPLEEPDDKEKTEATPEATAALQKEVPGLTPSEARRLLAQGINRAEKLRALGKEEALKLMTGRQIGHFGNLAIWQKPEVSGSKDVTVHTTVIDTRSAPALSRAGPEIVPTFQARPDTESREATERPKRTWDSIYPAVQRKLKANEVYDLEGLASYTKYEVYNLGFDWRTVDFFAVVLADNDMGFMTKAERTATERTKATAGPSASEKPLETAEQAEAIEKIAADISQIKEVLEGIGETILEAARESIRESATALEEKIQQAVKEALESIQQQLGEASKALEEKAQQTIREGLESIQQQLGEASATLEDINKAGLQMLLGKLLLDIVPEVKEMLALEQ